MRIIKPQPGPQTQFLSSPADLVIYGGARGGGKTFAALMEPLRHIAVPGFNAVIFRRTYPQITNPGGLWDKAAEIYPALGGKPSLAKCEWEFPWGSTIAFRHLKLEEHKFDWQGLQVCLMEWEELTHFSKSQFIFLMGSNRSTCGVRPYIRATCNPDADSWVKDLISPFLAEDGYVNLDEVGTIKYVVIEDEQFKFVDKDYRDSLGLPPISFTYVSADVWDNQELLSKDPGYLRNLMAQSSVDRDRFLGIRGRGGNWNARASAGKVFKPNWLTVVDSITSTTLSDHTSTTLSDHDADLLNHPKTKVMRFWDRAATLQQNRGDDPDWSVGVKMLLDPNGDVWVLDVIQVRVSPDGGDRLIVDTALSDGVGCAVRWFQDPGQAGVYQSQAMRKQLKGFDAGGVVCQLNKYQRAKPLSAACEHEGVRLLKGVWNPSYITELVGFPDAAHDDQVDASAGCYNELTGVYKQKFNTSQYRAA